MNVFDLVNDFYEQDSEWNSVIPRIQIENFLRSKSWQGTEDEELIKIWERLTLFCVYLGNSENFLGDMNREDFIDCVGWCARNVADFSLEGKNIEAFLDTITEFYQHLFKKKQILNVKAPAEAKDKLMIAGVLKIIDAKGNFLSSFDKHNQYSTPDLPAKIFLNVGEKMDCLLNAVQDFYDSPRFTADFQKASYLYGGLNLGQSEKNMPQWEEFNQGFWDYFLFDYHLLEVDKTPLEFFKDELDRQDNWQGLSKDITAELLKAHLVIFSVKGQTMDDTYECEDFLTGEIYTLTLPLEDDSHIDKMLFMGHIFYNDSMVVNFMKGVRLMENSRKRLREILTGGHYWFGIREGEKGDWNSFIRRNALFIRQTISFVANFVRTTKFEYKTDIKEYKPHYPVDGDAVSILLEKQMRRFSFAVHDVMLAKTLWGDFLQVADKKLRVPEIWAAGVIQCFVELNRVYNYDLDKISQMCHNVPVSSISRCSKEIKESLKLEKCDPRYISEEGMLAILVDVNA